MTEDYLQIRNLHIACAVVSITLCVVRGGLTGAARNDFWRFARRHTLAVPRTQVPARQTVTRLMTR